MLSKNFARPLGIALITIGLVAVPAWSAFALTNPAANPYPITVIGEDGNTYHDGQDTLPGYDDEECTYIPGAYFDFAKNRVFYADGKSIPWTEWDRASGYRAWLAKQKSPVSTTSSTSSAVKAETTREPAAAATAAADVTVSSEEVIEVSQFELQSEAPISKNPGRETGLLVLGVLAVLGSATAILQSVRKRLRQGGNEK